MEGLMNNQVGIAQVNGKQITVGGNIRVVYAVKELSKFGLITF